MGSIPNVYNVIPTTDTWISPAPRASGLCWKGQCGDPSLNEERLN
jgi:hypothetical protein